MNCPYCQKELTDPIKDVEDPDYKIIFETYACHPCSATFTAVVRTGHIIETILVSGNYRLIFTHEDGRCVLQKVDDHRGTYTGGRLWWEVLRLPTSPVNVNPQNVADKIKTLLVFS